MTVNGWLQLIIYMVVLLLLVKPLGTFMANVFEGKRTFLHPILRPLESLFYRAAGVKESDEQPWYAYAFALLLFNFLGLMVVYGLQRMQAWLPFNPADMVALSPDSSFNTAVSFASNTNWQGYGGETTMSYLTQMLALTVQNFVSAAAGMATLVAFIRGVTRHSMQTVGNFWVDMTRSTLYILLPLSLVVALFLVSQGVVQTFNAYQEVNLVQATTDADGAAVTTQTLAVGPAASQIAIKQLGTNGGGFFNVNSAHPFENPTPLSNFVQVLSILLIPAALCYTYGRMVQDTRQGWSLLAAMTLVFVLLTSVAYASEAQGNDALAGLPITQVADDTQSGGNMEGKETRYGIANSVLWATATTAASNGSVNSMHDSYTPIGGLIPMWLMQLGEIIYGGAGSGLYGMLAFVIVAVFIAGLMVGRTPEYMGKKVEIYEMKMASLIILIPPMVVLLFTALAVATSWGTATIYNPGPHGFSEVLYAFSSMGNNNGSAFAGLGANNPFYNLTGGLAMLIARYWLAIPVLAIAGSLARKKPVPATVGTLPTHTPLFIGWLIGVIVMVGALSFLPALALGPIVEQLMAG